MPRFADHEERRRELANAVLHAVAEGGLESVTVRSIARSAGWSTGVVNHYFSDKDELVRFALTAAVERVAARVAATTGGVRGPEALRRLLLAASPIDEERRQEWRAWLAFAARAAHDDAMGSEMATHYRAWEIAVVALLTGDNSDRTSPPAISHIAKQLIATVEGMALLATFRPDVVAVLERDIDDLVAAAFAALSQAQEQTRPSP